MARQRVEAPPATPPLYGLVIAAPDLGDSFPEETYAAGFKFAPEGCGDAGRVAVDCHGHNGTRAPGSNGAIIEGDPFLVWATDQCSTLGFAARDFEGRARRQLAASESFQIANELWTGDLAIADGLANRYLTDSASDTVTSSAGTPTASLGALVAALGAAQHGMTGMIHVTPQVLVLLAADWAVYRDGNIWRTPMGHRVVADDGYDGSGPGGTPASATQWMYATSTIRVGRGAVDIPGTFDENVNRDTNYVRIYAQRLALYEWTSECAHFAAEVAVPVPLVGPPS